MRRHHFDYSTTDALKNPAAKGELSSDDKTPKTREIYENTKSTVQLDIDNSDEDSSPTLEVLGLQSEYS